MTHDDAVLSINDGSYTQRFERSYPYPIERVWAALIEPEQRKQWMADGEITPEPGADFALRFGDSDDVMNGSVIRVDAPRVLEFHWWLERDVDSIVRWELSPDGEGTRFILTHTHPVTAETTDMLAGWHSLLERLSLVLNGKPSPEVDGRWNELKVHYVDLVAAQGIAPVTEVSRA